MTYLSPEAGFLEAERVDAGDPAGARAVVIPFGLEASVSYGGGTRNGPAAILAASDQLELYDEELACEPNATFGVATRVPTEIAADQAAALDQIEAEVSAVLEDGRFPLVLGGEHALTAGAIRPFVAGGEPITILQFDAHADLRDGYLGEHYSHASAMRRALDIPGVSVISVGIRAISKSEAEFYDANRDRITIHWAKDMDRWSIDEIVAPLAGKRVYVSFDIDGLDGAIMPATGTPTPGGLGYWQALAIMRAAARAGTIVGGDVVELAPIDGLHVCDYTAAAIAYKLMSYALLERSS
jgi:agmatinase